PRPCGASDRCRRQPSSPSCSSGRVGCSRRPGGTRRREPEERASSGGPEPITSLGRSRVRPEVYGDGNCDGTGYTDPDLGDHPVVAQREPAGPAAAYRATRVSGLIFTPGPIVDDAVIDLMYLPFD